MALTYDREARVAQCAHVFRTLGRDKDGGLSKEELR